MTGQLTPLRVHAGHNRLVGLDRFPRSAQHGQRLLSVASGPQEVLDASEVYLNGKQFGLALNARDAFDFEALLKPR